MREHHRPTQPGAAFFEDVTGGVDPADLREAADRTATLLVRGAKASDDDEVAERVMRLAETEGLEVLAELWSGAPADSLPGSLWRLYLLRSWVHNDPAAAAREFAAGREHAEVARVVAGVAEPPGPAELQRMADQVLRGLADRELADVLLRAAAFARVVATGRATLGAKDPERVLRMAEHLEHAALLELEGHLA